MNEAILYNMEKDAQEQHQKGVPLIFLAVVVIVLLILIALA